MPKRASPKVSAIAARCLLTTLAMLTIAWTVPSGRAHAGDTNDKVIRSKLLVGTQLTYRVRYKSEGYTELRTVIGAGPGSETPPRHDLFGSLEATEILTFLDHDRGGVRASIRFEKPVIKIQVDSKSQPEREREIVENLGHSAVVYFDAQSRVTRLEFPKEYPPMATNFVKAVVTLQQYAVPSSLGQDGSTWDMEETGANGKYAAHYHIAGTSGSLTRVTKTLGRSSSALANETSDSAASMQVVPQGKIQLNVNSNQGTVQDLDGVSHEDMLVQGHVLASQNTSVTAHIVSRVRLSAEDLSAAMRILLVPRGATNALVQPEQGLSSDRERAMQQQLLGTDSTRSLLDALTEIDGGSVSRDRQMNVYLKLKALIYLHPDASRTLGTRLSDAEPSKPSTDMIMTALSSVGSPAAQDALCTAIRSQKDDLPAMRALVPGLGSLPQPTERVVALLLELSHAASRDVRSMALLALGGAAKNLAQEANKRSSAIVSNLAAQFSAATVVDEKTTLLLALGNSGSTQAEKIILSQRNDQSSEMRRIATGALGDFQSQESLRALCDTLNADPDPQVRSAAAQALAPRSKVGLAKDSLLRAAQQDLAESVRIASMFALTDLIPRDEHVRGIITVLAEQDSSPAVRKQATSLLQQGQPQK
jgi:hypothetical protein